MSEPTNMTAPPPLPKDVDDAIHRLTDAHRHAESLGEHATASADRSAMARCDRAYCDLVERIRNALGAADAEAVRLAAEVDSAHATGVVHGHATATARLRAEVERAREERDAALTTVAGTEARAQAAESRAARLEGEVENQRRLRMLAEEAIPKGIEVARQYFAAERDNLVEALRDLTAECTDDPQEDDWLYQRALDRANRLLAGQPTRAEVMLKLDAAESRAARLEERLGVVRGVLKSVEWGGWDDLTGRTCPECEAPYDRLKHAPDCALAAALGES